MKEDKAERSRWTGFLGGVLAMVAGSGMGAPLPFLYLFYNGAGDLKWLGSIFAMLVVTLFLNLVLWRNNHKVSVGIFWFFAVIGVGIGFLLLMFARPCCSNTF